MVGAGNQWALLGDILTEFEPSVFEANLSAFIRAFADEELPGQESKL